VLPRDRDAVGDLTDSQVDVYSGGLTELDFQVGDDGGPETGQLHANLVAPTRSSAIR